MKTTLRLLRLLTLSAIAALVYAAISFPPLVFIAAPGVLVLIALALGV